MPDLDPSFLALPLAELSDAALSRAAELGCSHAEVRVERLREAFRSFRDHGLETTADRQVLGLSVRVVHDGVWGFAADIALTADGAARLAERAVATARVSRPLTPASVVLAEEETYPDATWVSAYEVDPFAVDEGEKVGRMLALNEVLLASPGVSHATAHLGYVAENKYFANLAGTATTQQRMRIQAQLTAVSVGDHGFATMRTTAPPIGRGWEYLTGTGWDFDAEVAEMGELLAEQVAAPSVEAGHYDLVIHPSNLFLTIHESIGHATELDRALGYEAAYAGTSFATFDQLGTPALRQPGDERDRGPAGRPRPGHHRLRRRGRRAAAVRHHLRRHPGRLPAEPADGGGEGAGPLQRVRVRRLARTHPDAADAQRLAAACIPTARRTEELISGVDRGIYIVGDKSWSIDMQRYNFQFTGQRFYRIEKGRLAGQLKDVAYQATTTDFWRSMEAVGGPETYVARRGVQLRQGSAGPDRAGIARLPDGPVPQHERAEHPGRRERA